MIISKQIISTNILEKILSSSICHHRKKKKKNSNLICILFEREFCFKLASRSGNYYLLYLLSTITIICSTILCHRPIVAKSSMRAQLNFYQRPPVVSYDEDHLVDNAKHKPSNGNDENNKRDESNLISDLDVPTANTKELRDMESRNGTSKDRNLVVNNQPAQVMFDEDNYYDDDDDDDDVDNENDDFEDDFYVENPLDLIRKTNELDYGKDIPVKDSDFRDVYGQPASVKTLPSNKNKPNNSQKKLRGKRKRKRRGRRKFPRRFSNGTYEPKTSSSGRSSLPTQMGPPIGPAHPPYPTGTRPLRQARTGHRAGERIA